jgi:iron complex transport system ATP-binding protein
MSEALLTARGVSYLIDGAQLVDDVDLTVDEGQLVAVVGPNGAGKTTLLSILSGDLAPTKGTVHYGTTVAGSLNDAERAVERAVFSERSPIDVPFTAWSVVSLGRYPHRHDDALTPEEDAGIVAAAMQTTDTSHLADRVYSTLSGGERTRVAIARVLAQATPIVLLDEPTTALDVYHQERILQILRATADQGRALVAVLHDLNTAAMYADRLVVMAGGRVVKQGPVEDVLDASLLTEVYGLPMAVVDHPLKKGKMVLVADDKGTQNPEVGDPKPEIRNP